MAVKLSDGVAIKIKDSSVLCNYPFTNKLKAIAKENSIKYQLEILEAGGTDTSGIQMSKTGVAVGALSIPMRYIHSGVETVSLDDVEECIKLLVLTANEDFKK